MNATKARVKLLQEHYNLQIHNPNIVLTQKVHNTFLKAKNPNVLCARCPPLPHTELLFFRAQTALRISLPLIPCISFFLSLLSQTTARTF